MVARNPLVLIGGRQQELPAGDTINGDDTIFRCLSADLAGANVATAQAFFSGLSAINLLAATTYEFELLANVTRAAGTTSHTTSTLFGGTATIASIDYIASVGNPTGNVIGPSSDVMVNVATAFPVTAANAVATENLRIWLRGIIRTTAAGTLIPQFQYSVAPGGAPTIKRSALIKLIPKGPSSVTAVN
jgi:hypothetical protein